MWSRAKDLSDEELIGFTFTKERSKYDKQHHSSRGEGGDLVLVDNAATSYGEVILGKIRIPAITDGYIHVRYVQSIHRYSMVFLIATSQNPRSSKQSIHYSSSTLRPAYVRLRARTMLFSTPCLQTRDTGTRMGIPNLGTPSSGKGHHSNSLTNR